MARPGIGIAEVKRASTLPIDAPRRCAGIGEGVVFDFCIAGTGIRLPRCHHYFAQHLCARPLHIQGNADSR